MLVAPLGSSTSVSLLVSLHCFRAIHLTSNIRGLLHIHPTLLLLLSPSRTPHLYYSGRPHHSNLQLYEYRVLHFHQLGHQVHPPLQILHYHRRVHLPPRYVNLRFSLFSLPPTLAVHPSEIKQGISHDQNSLFLAPKRHRASQTSLYLIHLNPKNTLTSKKF